MTSHFLRQFVRLSILLGLAIAAAAVGIVWAQPENGTCQVPTATYLKIEDALADPSCATITLAEGRFKENLVIDRPVSIEGSGAVKSIIDGRLLGQVIHINTGVTLILSDVTITRGQSGLGGGIYNEGRLFLHRVTVSNNSAVIDGGGIFNSGVTTIYDSTITTNTAVDFSGGGLRNEGRMYVNNSTVCLNKADFSGGGISNEDEGRLWIYSSTITANRGGVGGGIAGNEHGDGFVRINNTLVSDNRNANNTQPSDCARRISSIGYNQIANPINCDIRTNPGDILGAPALLGQRDGNPAYYPLTSFSPAIDSGDLEGCVDHQGNPLLTDQRGLARAGRCDIGAVEFDGEFGRVYLPTTMFTIDEGCQDFFDDFSDPQSGWDVLDNEFVEAKYLDGEYRILSKDPDFFYVFLSPSCPRDYYSVEVEARWVNEPGAIYGILFASTEDIEDFYIFYVNTDYQQYSILHMGADHVTEIAPLVESGAINKGSESNKLELHWQQGRIKAAVNGSELGAWPVDAQIKPSYAGVLAGSYNGQSRSDARFDNFSMVKEAGGSGENLATTTQPRLSSQKLDAAIGAFPRFKN